MQELFKFLIAEEIESISITTAPKAFKNCCQSSLSDEITVKTLSELIAKSRNFTTLNLSNCSLHKKSVNFIVNSLPNETPQLYFHGNSVSAESVCKFLSISSLKILDGVLGHLCAYGFSLILSGNPLTLNVTTSLKYEQDFVKLRQCLRIPPCVNRLKLEVGPIKNNLASTCLLNNPHLIQLVVQGVNFHSCCDSPDFLDLIKVILQHKAFEIFSFTQGGYNFQRVISREKLWLPYCKPKITLKH